MIVGSVTLRQSGGGALVRGLRGEKSFGSHAVVIALNPAAAITAIAVRLSRDNPAGAGMRVARMRVISGKRSGDRYPARSRSAGPSRSRRYASRGHTRGPLIRAGEWRA